MKIDRAPPYPDSATVQEPQVMTRPASLVVLQCTVSGPRGRGFEWLGKGWIRYDVKGKGKEWLGRGWSRYDVKGKGERKENCVTFLED